MFTFNLNFQVPEGDLEGNEEYVTMHNYWKFLDSKMVSLASYLSIFNVVC